MAIHNRSLQFTFPFQELIHRICILLGEFFNIDIAISINVTLGEQFVNDLCTVLLVNSLVLKELSHFYSIYLAVSVGIDTAKFLLNAGNVLLTLL